MINSQPLPEPQADFLLVIPCYRESKRLPIFLQPLVEKLATAPFTTKVLVIDDGSPAAEQQKLLTIVHPGRQGSVTILDPQLLAENSGKGGAILHGWRQSTESQWRAFVDADGATSPSEVLRVLTQVYSSRQNEVAYFAVRNSTSHRKVERTFFRSMASQVFTKLVHTILEDGLSDSQCGFKITSRQIFRKMEDRLNGFGLCFDLELYLALKSLHISIEEVLIDWKDQPGGHLNPLQHGPKMVLDLFRLRRAQSLQARRLNFSSTSQAKEVIKKPLYPDHHLALEK